MGRQEPVEQQKEKVNLDDKIFSEKKKLNANELEKESERRKKVTEKLSKLECR